MTLAGPAIAGEIEDAEAEYRELMCELKKVSDDPDATALEQTRAAPKVQVEKKRIARKYGREVADAAAISLASEGVLLCRGDSPDEKLMEALTRLFCDYYTELHMYREMNLYDDDESRKEQAAKFVPHQIKGLVKTFGHEKVIQTVEDFQDSGTDLDTMGPLECR